MSKRIDLTGKTFGKWTVLKYLGNQYYLCKCECGTERKVYAGNLRTGKTTSCGCENRDNLVGKKLGKITVLRKLPMRKTYVEYECQCECGTKFITSAFALKSPYQKSCKNCRNPRIEDITGKKFGYLTAIKYVGKSKGNQTLWECQCECGNKVVIHKQNLISGHTKSCGCLNRKVASERLKTHGDTNKRIYRIWHDMMYRCYSEKHKSYCYYGGKGISVCDEWKNYSCFKEWAFKNGYEDSLSIDRIDSNGNYEPSNCRWVDNIVQGNNTSRNLVFTVNGETDTLSNLCRKYNVSYSLAHNRIRNGWEIIDALTKPKQIHKKAGK